MRIYIGHFVEALDALLRSLRLNPNDPQAGSFLSFVALAHYHQGAYDEAAHYGELAVRGRRAYFALRTLAATLGQLGRTEEAKPILNELEGKKPANSDEYFHITTPYAEPAHREHLLEGLRKAGMEA